MPRRVFDTQSGTRATGRSRTPERLFTGLNLAVFLVLAGCVVAAVILWERGR